MPLLGSNRSSIKRANNFKLKYFDRHYIYSLLRDSEVLSIVSVNNLIHVSHDFMLGHCTIY